MGRFLRPQMLYQLPREQWQVRPSCGCRWSISRAAQGSVSGTNAIAIVFCTRRAVVSGTIRCDLAFDHAAYGVERAQLHAQPQRPTDAHRLAGEEALPARWHDQGRRNRIEHLLNPIFSRPAS